MLIADIVILLAGIANFAMHRWMLESGHPAVVAVTAPVQHVLGRNATYVIEFALLVGALWLASAHDLAAMLVYGVYTAANVGTVGWLKGGG